MSSLPDIDNHSTQTGYSRFAWTASRRTHVVSTLLASLINPQCARIASSNNATMLVILIAGLTAGPAVSL